MTLDERIRIDLETAASAVPAAAPRALDQVRKRGRRRQWTRRVGWGVASLTLVFVSAAVTGSFDPNRIDPAETHRVSTAEIADLAVTVVDSEPVLSGPDVWVGLPGPTPRFDTSVLGPDLSFGPGAPVPGDLDERNMRNDGWPTVERAVYLGELEGEPFYIYSAAAPSIWDRIFEVIDGNFSGDVLGTSLNCCTGGDMDHQNRVPGISHLQTTGEPDLIVVEWLGLSPDVSVVAYQLDGEFIGWQTPVGGVSSLRLDRRPDEYLGVTFDAAGQELDRFGPQQLRPVPDLPARIEETEGTLTAEELWAPLTSEGSEIQADDMPAELRDEISPLPGDRFFRVSVDDGEEVFVVVRDDTAHVYAISCQVLAGVDLPPGWAATCFR